MRSRRELDRARLGDAGRVADHELILAARIGKPCELRSIRRPYRTAIVRARSLREIAVIALFRCDCKNIAARFERSANSGRRKRGRAYHGRDFLKLRTGPRQIAACFDIEPPRLPRFRIEEIDESGLLV